MKRNILLPILSFLIACAGNATAQFGPIGFDFKDPYVAFDNLRFAVRLSTENNIYCPDQGSLRITKTSSDALLVTCDILSSAGGQLSTPGKMELRIASLGNSRLSVSATASHPTELCKTILVLIKGIEVTSFVSEYPQAKGVNEFKNRASIMVSYPSRSATMPLVFVTTPKEEWFVLSKDKELRRKGFACVYDHLTKEPVILL